MTAQRTGWTMREIAAEFVKDIEAAHGKGAPDLADEWPDLHAAYEVAVRTLAETSVQESRLAAALKALLDWGREHTSPRDANSPHALLVAATEALDDVTPWIDDERSARAWRYATRSMTDEDAAAIRYDCQREGGFYPLAAFTRERVLEQCQDRWGDFPMLASLVEIACQRVLDKWSGDGHDADAAESWAMELIEEAAKREGFDLVDSWNNDAAEAKA
jgi:hypothetical protein